LKIDGSGKVSFISETDMTEFINILSESGISKKELWAQMQNPNSENYKEPSTGLSSSASVTYSSPYIMTVRDTGKFEDLKERLSVSSDGTTLTMTTKDEDEDGFDRETILTKK
ncbi:MAG TPA: hypothetical protein VJ861_11560, partial [Treponemataceae bacterium]|nr:hypothetical protein [Treponemataceae bacterium]